MTAPRREADRSQLERFVNALFPHAEPGTYASLRSFAHRQGERPAKIQAVRLNGHGLEALVTEAHRHANWAANHREPLVFAPPVATFTSPKHAAEADLAQGLVISLEADEHPTEALQAAMAPLGMPTVIMASGGTWTDPETGEVQDKLHLHWRLRAPTSDPAGHAKLKHARRLAALLVGADGTAVPAVHPLRWAGSLHLKDPDNPKTARIVGGDADAEVDLAGAIVALEGACRAAGIDPDKTGSAPGDRQEVRETAELVARVTQGVEFLAPLVSLSARYAAAGMNRRQIVDTLRGFLEAVPDAARDLKDGRPVKGRWQDRWNGCERMAASAVAKYGPKAQAQADSEDGGSTVDEPRRLASETGEAGAPPAEVERTLIQLTEEHVNDTALLCARMLDEDVFLRGARPVMLVRVKPAASETGVVHPEGALILVESTVERAQHLLDARALFQRYDARNKAWVAKSCPENLAKRILGVAPELRFRPCAGIVGVPLFIDGEVYAEPGFHPATGNILDLTGPPPVIPDRPSKAEALAALETLLQPFSGYIDGKAEPDRQRLRCGFSAAAMTAVVRPSLRSAPAVLIDGNVPGSGKGKGARALGVIATGRPPTIVTEGHGPEETEKRIASAVLSGSPALLLDNLQRMLASSTLESGLTEGAATIRTFGRLGADTTVPCGALIIVTANNATLRADMLRRTLPVRIVSDSEEPELKKYAFDPFELALEKRDEIVAAGLTIAKAWWQARDEPKNREFKRITLGSFERWAELVGGAVAWLTGMSPVALIEERKKQDPRIANARAVITALREKYGRGLWYAKDAAAEIDADLWRDVLQFKSDRPSGNAVSYWLRSRKDHPFGDLKLAGDVTDRNGTVQWQVRGIAGDSGGSSHPLTRNCQNNQDMTYDSLGGTVANIPRDHPSSPAADGGWEGEL